jgi:hypothetical protein
MFRRLSTAAILVAASLAVGCGGPTYINIPAQEGDLAGHDPNGNVVREVTAEAVRGLLQESPKPGPVAVFLPAGASALSHADVARRVGEGAVSPYEAGVNPATQLEVKEIRIRAHEAQVDIVAPGRGNINQVTTVFLGWAPFGGWKAERTRTWQAPAQATLPSRQITSPTEIPQ